MPQRWKQRKRRRSRTSPDHKSAQEEMQEKTFLRWANIKLEEGGVEKATSLFKDFRDGNKLLHLLEELSNQKLPREKAEKGVKSRTQCVANINRALQFLQDAGINVGSLNSNDVFEGNSKATLHLFWYILQYYYQNCIKDVPTGYREFKMDAVLMSWCRFCTQGYNVQIQDFASSWKDGLAFAALVHKFRPDLFEFDAICAMDDSSRLSRIFHVIATQLQVEKLLDPEDVNSDHIDRKAVTLYVLCLFEKLPHDVIPMDGAAPMIPSAAPQEASDGSAAVCPDMPSVLPAAALQAQQAVPTPPSAESLAVYTKRLEELLAWILEAEERLAESSAAKMADVDAVKKHYQHHEELMFVLSQNQTAVSDVLNSGMNIVQSMGMTSEEGLILTQQVHMLQTRWERLQTKALDRQSTLKEKLRLVQSTQLEKAQRWMESTEQKINEYAPVAMTVDACKQQQEELQALQTEINQEQPAMNALGQMILLPDDAQLNAENVNKVLEDISKRWAGIYQWTEKRASRLNGLADKLTSVYGEQIHFVDWMDQKEAALSTLRRSGGLSSTQDVLEQAQNLKLMQEDLENKHQRFVTFTKAADELCASMEVENPQGVATLKKSIAEVKKRWDKLVARMDEASSETTAAPVHTRPQFTLEPSLSLTGEEATNAFQDQLASLCEWLDRTEALLVLGRAEGKNPFDELSHEEQLAVCEVTERDIASRDGDLEALHTIGHAMLEKIRAGGDDGEPLETVLSDVNGRWRDLHLILADRKRQCEIAVQAERIRDDLRTVDEAVLELAEWADCFEPDAISDLENIRLALQQCTEKLEVVKEREPQVEDLQRRLERLSANVGADDRTVRHLQDDFDQFTTKWAHVVDRISSSLETLTGALEKTPAASSTYAEAVAALHDWLDTVDDVLNIKGLDAADHADVMTAKLEKLLTLRNDVEHMKHTLEFVNEDSDGEASKEELDAINSRWEEVTSMLMETLDLMEVRLRHVHDLDTKSAEMDDWMAEVTVFLASENPALGDVDLLKAQMQQSEGLVKDIDILQPKLERLNLTAAELADKASPEFAEHLAAHMKALSERWADVVRRSELKHQTLQAALDSSVQVTEDLGKLVLWLTKLDADLQEKATPTSGKELQSLAKKYKQVKDELVAQSDAVEVLMGKAATLLSAQEVGSQAARELDHQLLEVREQWTDVVKLAADRHAMFTSAFEHWKEFQELVVAEKICLDQLERKLAEPVTMATDAEEYSEQLDLLERLMEGNGNRERLLASGDFLLKQGLMTAAVNAELEKYSGRREALLQPAKERQQYLEAGVAESQMYEQQLLDCQSWMAHVDCIISARLESDIYAAEVPEDYKQALAAGTLPAQLQQEFDEHHQCIARLEAQVHTYREAGKEHAASRLHEQIQHVKNAMSEVQAKFVKFQRPSDLDQRLERAFRIVRDLENSLDLLRLHSDIVADVLDQQEKSQRMFATMLELQAEVDYVIKTGRQVLEEHLYEKEDELRERLDRLQQRYDLLTRQLNSCKEGLDRAESVLKDLDRLSVELTELLKSTEAKIQSWEADQPSVLVDDEIRFVEQNLQDLVRHETSMQLAEDCVQRWCQLADTEVTEHRKLMTEKLRHRWAALQEHLRHWLESLNSMKHDTERTMSQFSRLVSEVTGWLGIAEQRIQDLKTENAPPEKLVDAIKKLQAGAADLRPKLDQLRDHAVELASKGDSWQQQVEPDLTAVNTRWENAITEVKRLQRTAQPGQSPVRSPSMKKPAPLSLIPKAGEKEPEEYPESGVSIIVTPGTPTERDHDRVLKRMQAVESSETTTTDTGTGSEVESEEAALVTDEERRKNQSLSADIQLYRRDAENTVARFNELKRTLEANKGATSFPMSLLREYDALQEDATVLRARHAELVDRQSELAQDSPQKTPSRARSAPLDASELERLEQKRHDVERLLASIGQQRKREEEQAPPFLSDIDAEVSEIMQAQQRDEIEDIRPSPEAKSVDELIVEVQRLTDILSDVEQRLKESPELNENDYANFSNQEDVLKSIKDTIEAVDQEVDLQIKQQISLASRQGAHPQMEQLGQCLKTLQSRVKLVSQTYLDKYNHYLLCFNCWQAFHRELALVQSWLEQAETRLAETRNSTIEIDVEKTDRLLQDLEDAFSTQEKSVQHVLTSGQELIQSLPGPDAEVLRAKLETIAERWEHLAAQMELRRDRLEEDRLHDATFREELEDLLFWLDESEALLTSHADPTDRSALYDLTKRFQEKQGEVPAKTKSLTDLKATAEKIYQAKRVPDETKEALKDELDSLESRLRKAKHDLARCLKQLDEQCVQCDYFWQVANELSTWVGTVCKNLEEYNNAVLYTPMKIDINVVDREIHHRKHDVDQLLVLFGRMRDTAERHEVALSETTLRIMEQLTSDWSTVLQLATKLRTSSSSLASDEDSVFADAIEEMPVRSEQALLRMPEPTGPDLDESQAAVYAEIIKPARKKKEVPTANRSGDEVRTRETALVGAPVREPPFIDLNDGVQRTSKVTEQLKELNQLKLWLSDTNREFASSVDITDIEQIKDASRKHQEFLDQLQTKRVQLIRVLESSKEPEVRHKAELLCREWERNVYTVTKRRKELAKMLDECRKWDDLRSELELWLNETEQRLNEAHKVAECTIDELQRELRSLEILVPEVDFFKEKMHEFNALSNRVIDAYPSDDSTLVSQTSSEMNTQWSRLSDSLRVRRAVLEASLRGRSDFVTAVSEFARWLNQTISRVDTLDQDTSNVQLIKDTVNRRTWLEREKDLRVEIEAHADVFQSLRSTGRKVLDSIDSAQEKRDLDRRLLAMDEQWAALTQQALDVRRRLETAEEQWEKLTTQLRELIYWVELRERELKDQSPVGGSLELVRKQHEFMHKLLTDMESKGGQVREIIQLSQSFLIQQDMRPRMHSPPDGVPVDEDNEDTAQTLKRQSRRVAQQIKAESDTLFEKWNHLRERSDKWQRLVAEALSRMIQFDKMVAEADKELSDAEEKRSLWMPVRDVQLNDLPRQLEQAKLYEKHVARIGLLVDDVNDHSCRLLAENVNLAQPVVNVIEQLNQRYNELHTVVQQRVRTLDNALREFGPSSQHFLSASVAKPWNRAISENRVPYFVNHDTQKTQWDHPQFQEFMDGLCEFNDVKFSAYRTSMKLRALQKKLCFDLLNLQQATMFIDRHKMKHVPDRMLDVGEMVMCLLDIYEALQKEQPKLVTDLPVLIDSCLNWILNLYDPARGGIVRALSFNVAIVLMCQAHLDEKYSYLFGQVSMDGCGIDQKKLALLLYDCIQLPKLLGEVASFGGSNIEPSVRSCFERYGFPPQVSLEQYLDWLKCEPQSLVWLPVMHRIAAAETAKHQSKCNVCKMYPIIGLRYRCLKCFNFDMCQNCFFSQRKAKNHKLAHPMQEYCIVSTSGQDVRDFGRIMKNKLRTKSYWKKHPQLGYLPVESIAEGSPIETRSSTPSNPATEHLHSRLELYAARLAEVERSQTVGSSGVEDGFSDDEHQAIGSYCASLSSQQPVTPKSPAQIVAAIDGMQKEELAAIVQQLENENRQLQAEYDRLKNVPPTTSTPILAGSAVNGTMDSPTDDRRHVTMTNGHGSSYAGSGARKGFSTASLPHHGSLGGKGALDIEHEQKLLNEARALRQHKAKLEARMNVLEDHNRQLEAQLSRLKQIIEDGTGTESGSIASHDVSSLRRSTLPHMQNGHHHAHHVHGLTNGHHAADYADDSYAETDTSSRHIGDLMSITNDLSRAMGTLVNAVTSDDEYSGEEDASEFREDGRKVIMQ